MKVFYTYNLMSIKTSFIIPEDLYRELKRRALEEGRTMKEILVDALLNYLSSNLSKREIVDLLKPIEGAGPEDLEEYGYEDVGG